MMVDVTVEAVGRKLLALQIECESNSDSAHTLLTDVHPMMTYSQLRRTVAEKIEAPAVNLYLQGPNGGKLPVRLENNDAIAIALNSGDVMIAEDGQEQSQSDSNDRAADTTPPFPTNDQIPKPPPEAIVPGGSLDDAHVVKLKEWVDDAQKQTGEFERTMIEAAKNVRDGLEKRKIDRNQQIKTLEEQIADYHIENQREESECDKVVKAIQRTAQEHYATVNRSLKIVKTLMKTIDTEVAETIPTEISVKPWTYNEEFGVDGEALTLLSLVTTDDSSTLVSGVSSTVDVARGTISQYSVRHGVSASASICVMAAKDFLVRGSLDCVSSVDLDIIVRNGAKAHGIHEIQHAVIDEIWVHDTFSETVAGLTKGAIHYGVLNNHEGFQGAFRHVMNCKDDQDCEKDKFGILFTKSGETVLCLCHDDSWYLFDSHGESHTPTKRAYLKRFGSMDDVASALLAMYPVRDLGGGSQSDLYNMFESTPVLVVSRDGTGNLQQDNDASREASYPKTKTSTAEGGKMKITVEYLGRVRHFTRVSPRARYSKLKSVIAECLGLPNVKVYRLDHHRKRQEIDVEDDTRIADFLQNGDHLIAVVEGSTPRLITAKQEGRNNANLAKK